MAGSYHAGTALLDVLPSMKGFHSKIRREIAGINPSVGVDLVPDAKRLSRRMKDVTKVARIPPVQVRIDANTAALKKAEQELVAAEKRMSGARDTSRDSVARLQIAEKQLDETRRRSGAKASQIASAELKVAQAKRASAAAANDLRNAESARSGARSAVRDAQLKVDADTTGAIAKIAALRSYASRALTLNGHVDLDIGAALAKLTILSAKGAAVSSAFGGIGAVAGGAFVALPGAVAASGAAIGALTVGLNGTLDAFKAFSDAEKQTATNATANAQQQTSAARQIASAQQQVVQARTGLARVYEDTGLAAAASDRRLQDAERQLVSAQRAALQAQQDLTRARDDAKRAMRDLNFEVQGGALAERQAVLDLADAQAELDAARKKGVKGTELDRVQLAYEQQALSLQQVQARNRDLATEKAAADKAGVNGSEQVVSAQERARDAAEGVADAQRGVADAQRESAQQQIQAQRAIADAQLQVAQAQIQLRNAIEDSGTVGAASVDKINAAMAELAPNAQSFVLAMRGLKPEFEALGDSVQNKLFAGLDVGFTRFATQVLPQVEANLGLVAGALNGLTTDMLGFLATGEVAGQFQQIFAGTARLIAASSGPIQSILGLILQMSAAAMPALSQIMGAIGTVATQLSAALAPLIASGQFQAAIGTIANLITALAPMLADIVTLAVQLGATLGPPLVSLIQTLVPVISMLAPILTQLAQIGMALLVPVLQVAVEILAALLPPVQAILNAFMPLVPVIVSVVRAITPLITQFVSMLAPVLTQIAGIITQVLQQAIVALLPVLTMLFQAAMQILDAFMPFLPLLIQVAAQIISAVLPAIVELAPVVVMLVQTFAPLLPQLTTLAMTLLPVIVSVIQALMPIITVLAKVLGSVLGVVLRVTVLPLLAGVIGLVGNVVDIFTVLWKVVGPIFEAVGAAGKWLWEKALKPSFEAINGAIDEVIGFFGRMGDTIGGIWDAIKSMVHAGVQGIVDLIYNNGIRAIANAVIQYIPGVDYLPEWKVPMFAGGGVLPGFAPGRDTELIMASPGEAILVPELVRMLGVDLIVAANAAASGRPPGGGMGGLSGFAGGGVVGAVASGMASATGAGAPGSVTIDPAALGALGEVAETVTAQVTVLAAQITTVVVPAIETLGQQSRDTSAAMVAAVNVTWTRQQQYQTQVTASWTQITAVVWTSVRGQGTALTTLQAGLAATRTAMEQTAATAVTQFGRIRGAAADPMRWVLTHPVNAGLIAAWNRINTDFDLRKPVNPVPIGFASGGRIRGPGTGTSDSIPLWGSDGEFMVRERITRRVLPFLEALNSGQPEALQAAGYKRGGLIADTGGQLNAALARGAAWMTKQDDKPYVWGAVGPDSYDCSGLMSALTNVLRGETNPYRRVGTARSEPWPGFVRGLSSAFTMGASPTHTAGTLAGVNVESTGSHVRFGGDAHGADDPQFSTRSSLPVVGGKFVPGGGALDLSALIGPYYADTHRLIGQITALYAGMLPRHSQGVVRRGAGGAQQSAISALGALTSASSGGSPQVKSAVRAVAATLGWGSGAQWAALDWIINRESGWNPAAANPTSSARGLFQKMTSVHGPLESTIAGQARWGLNYIRSRYHDPIGARAYWQANGWYDRGGVATNPGILIKGTAQPERVLSPAQTRSFDRLVSYIGSGRGLTTQPAGVSTGGTFTGNLYLDSGELMGVVDGRIDQATDEVGSALLRGPRI